MKIEPNFGIGWVSVSGDPISVYTGDRMGGYAIRPDVEQLQEQAARMWRCIDLMRRADDIETVRAIANICIGEPRHG
jgi:hypothetical protein